MTPPTPTEEAPRQARHRLHRASRLPWAVTTTPQPALLPRPTADDDDDATAGAAHPTPKQAGTMASLLGGLPARLIVRLRRERRVRSG